MGCPGATKPSPPFGRPPCSEIALTQQASWPGIAVRRTASLRSPMSRPSTPYFGAKAWMPATSAGMTVESDASHEHKFQHRDFLSSSMHFCCVRQRCRAAHPGGLSCQVVGFEPFAPPTEGSGAPKFAGADRRARWSALRQDRSRQRTGLPIHNADRRAFRRSAAAFSLSPRTAFWKRTGAPIRNALDSAGFLPRSSAPTSPLPDGPT